MMDEDFEPMNISETFLDDAEENTESTSRANIPVIENPNLDLETYISAYTDRTKLDRLELIASRCPSLAVDAYKLAIEFVKTETMDTRKYTQLVHALNQVLTQHHVPCYSPDTEWMETTQRKARLQFERLETELKNYKHTCIKESIRMGQNDLGDHAYHCGDFMSALKYYSRARDYCSSSKHILNMCLKIIKVSLCISDFSHVMGYVNKAKDSEPHLPPAIECRFHLCSALASLHSKNYSKVVHSCSLASYAHISHCTDLCSANDVTMMSGLCALASFERKALKTFLENENVRLYLDLDPFMKELLRFFYQAQYARCLTLLKTYQTEGYLHLHVCLYIHDLMCLIRQRMLIQYVTPYSIVNLSSMAKDLQCSFEDLEHELMTLIQLKKLRAKIHSPTKLLYRQVKNHRSEAFLKTLNESDTLIAQTQLLQLKLNMLQQNLILGPK